MPMESIASPAIAWSIPETEWLRKHWPPQGKLPTNDQSSGINVWPRAPLITKMLTPRALHSTPWPGPWWLIKPPICTPAQRRLSPKEVQILDFLNVYHTLTVLNIIFRTDLMGVYSWWRKVTGDSIQQRSPMNWFAWACLSSWILRSRRLWDVDSL